MVETRKTEIRYVTSDPEKMLNMYLAKRVIKTWEESFVDQDTGETVNIERHELLFERGTLIDQDVLNRIQFSMLGDGITEVEVSNQNRVAFELENNCLYPYLAQVQIGDRKHKFLLYATGLDNVLEILKDYIELNYNQGFRIIMAKEFDSCIILSDNLEERKIDDAAQSFIKDEITMEEYVDELTKSDANKEETKSEDKKFYQIETNITFDEELRTQTFVVHTFNVDKAMMLIANYLKKKEEECEMNSVKNGHEFNKREIHTAIESAKPIPVGCFIPKEFSIAYMES